MIMVNMNVDGDKYEGFWENDKIAGKGKYEFVMGVNAKVILDGD